MRRIPPAVAFLALVLVGASSWQAGHSQASAVLVGDLDCDQDVDAVDALTGLQFIAGFDPPAGCINDAADTNCNGGVDADDSARILRVLADLLTPDALGCPSGLSYQLLPLYPGGFERVVHFALMPGSGNIGVIGTQQEAKLHKIDLDDPTSTSVFGDLSGLVGGGTELEGLLNFAFSPSFVQDDTLYVYYTQGFPEPAILSAFEIVGGEMDMDSERVLLEVPSFSGYNYGGSIEFDSEGSLYISIGDSGPPDTAQDNTNILGSVVRLDVSGPNPVAHPDNPFVGQDGADEIYAYGFRNPWRMTVDTLTDQVYLGDVGEFNWEEVNRVDPGGNYGWRDVEGNQCFFVVCDLDAYEPPLYVFPHIGDLTSITGGHVYRGSALPELYGWYLYGEFYLGEVWAINPQSSLDSILLVDADILLPSFSYLPGGEIAVVGFDGTVYEIARAQAALQ